MTAYTPSLLKQRSELLDFLLEVSEVSAGTLELDRLLPAVAELVKKVIDYEIFAILLAGDGGVLRIRFSIGHREEVVERLRIQPGEGITGAVAASRKPLLVNDVRQDPRYLNALDAARSELAVPMVARGRLVGVIDIQSTRLHAFTEGEQGIVELIASRVAMAIDNARLYRRVVRQNRTLRTLTAIAQEFSSLLELDPLLRKISELVRQLIDYDAFSIMLLEPAEAMLKDYFSVRYDKRVPMDNVPVGRGIIGTAAESKQPVLVPDTSRDSRYLPWYEGIRSEVAVPLLVQTRLLGVLNLESEQLNHFTEEHVRTLTLLAPQITTAIENARLYERVAEKEARLESDLQAARQLQQHLLPVACPRIEGLDICTRWEPARQIGGDLYDFLTFGDSRPGFMVGDVSGKGAAAALYGALVIGLLRSHALQHDSPASLLRALNLALLERKVESSYLTLLCACWHREDATLVVANAGMPLPILCTKGHATEQRIVGIPLGLLGDTQYEEVALPLAPGDTAAICSDGIIDTRDRFGQDYGRERLVELIERHGNVSASALIQKIFHDVKNHAAGAPQFDDQTILVVKRNL
jgi:sigma-B regulation protein RsbU (phosphoserine phosphatase)